MEHQDPELIKMLSCHNVFKEGLKNYQVFNNVSLLKKIIGTGGEKQVKFLIDIGMIDEKAQVIQSNTNEITIVENQINFTEEPIESDVTGDVN